MSKSLIPKLEAIKQRYNEVADLIIQPDVISDQKKYGQLNKEYSDLGKIVAVFDQYKQALNTIEESDEIIADGSDKDFVELAKIEKNEAIEKIPGLEEELKILLIPKDPADDKNVIVELRAGTGGDEAAIFVEDVYRAYAMYFKSKGWKHEITDSNEASKGYKELILKVEGDGVYGIMKFESGVHRVQRVPETESQGRVHTSAITVSYTHLDVYKRQDGVSIPQLQRCSFASCKKGATPFRFFSKPVPLFTLSFLFFPTQFPSTKTKKDAVAIGAKLKVHFFI